tara:strand:+ start:24192 stop:26375 length:2184 start_codon:yes stop_codon:yes gene_type:complete
MANKKKNLTVFQRLNNIFSPEGINVPKSITNRYAIGNDALLTTKDKSEYDQAKLQAQQNKYLGGMWKKVDGELFQHSVHYETTRIGSYTDFESMEFYPEISAALDVMMEEATTINEKGRVLNVYSDSKRVKTILEDLFFNRLDVHTTLPMWTRNTCKYGDNFVFLNIDDKAGVIGARQLPNFEIERREGDLYNRLLLGTSTSTDPDDDPKVKFYWRGRDIEFSSWQVGHFRLLGDDRRLPYGTSVLEKGRRIWKQLLLSEDAMLIYRVTRAPERRIYKIYVGNIDDADVGAYVDEIANRFKRTPIMDSKTGQIDVKYNQLANDQDFFIPVRTEDAPSPIETLPGASNLDQIADIEYLQRKLFTALRVPKSFIGYEDAMGDGKNLALQDIRFTRTINRIQQAMIQELNKIAILHLFLLGLEDELDNFTLTLNNPSTQAEMLRTEHLQAKITLFKDAVSDAGNGFAPMSMTRGKREILEWSDDEIKQDLLEQRMEKAAAAELENTTNVIKHTGMFDTVDRIYGDMDAAKEGGQSGDGGEGEEGGDAGGGGGGFGGGGLGGLDFGEGGDEDLELDDGGDGLDGGDEGGGLDFGEDGGGEDLGGDDTGGDTGGDAGATEESFNKLNLLKEDRQIAISNKKKCLSEHDFEKATYYREKEINLVREIRKHTGKSKINNNVRRINNIYSNKLINSIRPEKKEIMNKRVKVLDRNMRINENINEMIKDIDKTLDE